MQLLLALLFSAMAMADPAKVSLGSVGTAEVQLVETEDQTRIKIELPDGSRQAIGGLGEHWQFVHREAESKLIVVKDFDGDGQEDFVVRVTVPPQASHVYVYHYDAQLRKFIPFLFADDDHLTADYNELVEVLPEGIAFEGEEWPASDEFKSGAPVHTRKVWHFAGKRFLPF